MFAEDQKNMALLWSENRNIAANVKLHGPRPWHPSGFALKVSSSGLQL
jgi:hypothetical protein